MIEEVFEAMGAIFAIFDALLQLFNKLVEIVNLCRVSFQLWLKSSRVFAHSLALLQLFARRR